MNVPARLVALLAASGIAHAQATLEFADGVLGEMLYLNVDGDPFEIFGVAPSLNEGPFPLSLIDPGNPDVLDVGTDLLPFWEVSLLDAGGSGTIAYPIPLNPTLVGNELYIQAVTAPGTTTLIDEVTNRVNLTLALEGDSVSVGAPPVPRRFASATLLLDGRILIAGGADPATLGGGSPVVYGDAEIFDPQTGAFGPPIPMPEERARHSATLLDDGRVLMLGGFGNGGQVTNAATVFDPSTDTFQSVMPMFGARVHHTATKLADGRVFVHGGAASYSLSDAVGFPDVIQTLSTLQTELFDPGVDFWSPGPVLVSGRMGHSGVLLNDGTVLISGGFRAPPLGPPQTTSSCRRYDPVTNSMTSAGSLLAPSLFHSTVLMHDGNVLLTGGGFLDPAIPSFAGATEAFTYDPGSAAWSAAGSLGGVVGPDGTTFCVCKREVSKPLDVTTPCIPDKITYGSGGGGGLYDPMTGMATPQDAYFSADSSLTTWTTGGTALQPYVQPTLALHGDGARMLMIGTTALGGPAAENWIVSYP